MIFLKLPIILIQEIASYRNLENADLISFSLTCKRFYYERDKYMLFDPTQSSYSNLGEKPFCLSSYKNIFKKTLDVRRNLALSRMYIYKEDKNIYYDYVKQYKPKVNLIIPADVKTLHIDGGYFSYLPFQLPDYSNLTEIIIFHYVGDAWGDTIELDLKPNYLPSTLKTFILYVPLTTSSFSPDVFPKGLTTFKHCHSSSIVIPKNVLPPSLTSLHATGCAEYPPNLKRLKLRGGTLRKIPATLQVLSLLHSSLCLDEKSLQKILKNHPNLKKIKHINIRHLKYLPPSVTSISLGEQILNYETLQPGLIPNHIIKLDFLLLQDFRLQAGSIPSSVKSLKLGFYNDKIVNGLLPNGLTSLRGTFFDTSLELKSSKKLIFDMQSLPDKIKKLNIQVHNCQFNICLLPPNLEELTLITNYQIEISNRALPSTLSLLSVNMAIIKDDAFKQATCSYCTLRLLDTYHFFKLNRLEALPTCIKTLSFNDFNIRRVDTNLNLMLYSNIGGFIDNKNLQSFLLNKVDTYIDQPF